MLLLRLLTDKNIKEGRLKISSRSAQQFRKNTFISPKLCGELTSNYRRMFSNICTLNTPKFVWDLEADITP